VDYALEHRWSWSLQKSLKSPKKFTSDVLNRAKPTPEKESEPDPNLNTEPAVKRSCVGVENKENFLPFKSVVERTSPRTSPLTSTQILNYSATAIHENLLHKILGIPHPPTGLL
jgi:hypothetical protein